MPKVWYSIRITGLCVEHDEVPAMYVNFTCSICELFSCCNHIVQELCEIRGGRAGLSVLTSLLVSVDVKLYWSQAVRAVLFKNHVVRCRNTCWTSQG